MIDFGEVGGGGEEGRTYNIKESFPISGEPYIWRIIIPDSDPDSDSPDNTRLLNYLEPPDSNSFEEMIQFVPESVDVGNTRSLKYLEPPDSSNT